MKSEDVGYTCTHVCTHIFVVACFGELTMTPYVSTTLTFTNVVNGPDSKFRSNIASFVNIDLSIAPKP